MGSISGAPEGGEPETTGRPGAKATVPGEKAGAARRPARILILEDDAWDAELAQRLLTGAGLDFTAVVVDTRTAFAEQLAAFRPDIILSDFHLPGFTGEVALEIAQQQCPHIPFIIWSGVLGDEAAVGLIKQGATDYVLKDRPARLASAIQRALAEAEQRAYLAQLEDQLFSAQRLASLGQLAAAEEAVNLTRQRLAAARRQATAADPPP
jgi:DNA-binding NtrC family response regulator